MSRATPTVCPHCRGPVEHLGRGRTADIYRCKSCGRSPSDAISAAATNGGTSNRVEVTVLASGSPCPVNGCPGTVVGGRCACCARRQAYAEEHIPKRTCEICNGPIGSAHGGRKLCKACAPIAVKIRIAKAKRGTQKAGAR